MLEAAGNNYSWVFPHLAQAGIHPSLVAEVGSRDGLDAITLASHYQVRVLVFEPDPINAETCRTNLAGRAGIDFFEIALAEHDGEVQFYSVDPDLYGNRGASSLYKISFADRPKADPDFGRGEVQRQVTVLANRFDSLNLPVPEFLAIDVQGAELQVLRGFGPLLSDVRAVAVETSFTPSYIGAADFDQLHRFMTAAGFALVHNTRTGSPARPYRSLLGRLFGRRSPDFDCLYLRL